MATEYYKPHHVAKLFGISVDSLYYYEREGIISPPRNPANGYRLYGPMEIRKLSVARELLELGFPMARIKEFFSEKSLAATMRIFNSEISSINKDIARLLKIKSDIEARLMMYSQGIAQAQKEEIVFREERIRDCILICDHSVEYDSIDSTIVKYLSAHNIQVTLTGMADCYILDVNELNAYNCLGDKAIFLYSPSENYRSNYSLPAGTYAQCTYRGFSWRTPDILLRLLKEIICQGYEINGDPLEFCIIDEYESDDEEEYVTRLEIRVEPCGQGKGNPRAHAMLEAVKHTLSKRDATNYQPNSHLNSKNWQHEDHDKASTPTRRRAAWGDAALRQTSETRRREVISSQNK